MQSDYLTIDRTIYELDARVLLLQRRLPTESERAASRTLVLWAQTTPRLVLRMLR